MAKFKRPAGLYRLTGKVKHKTVFGFDTETCNNNKDFVCCSIVGKDYEKFFTSKEDFKKELLNNQIYRNSFICATNLLFDISTIFGTTELLRQFTLIDRGSGIVYAKTYIDYNSKDRKFNAIIPPNKDARNYYKIEFIDSLNHHCVSVKQLGKIIGIEKLKSEVVGQMPKDEREWTELREYNIQDSRITYNFMEWLQQHYNNIGGNLRITISSTALDTYRREFQSLDLVQEKRSTILEQYKSYYGGRTEAFKRGNFNSENYGKIKVYDVNSLYPYCMKEFKFPIPSGYVSSSNNFNNVENFEGVGHFKLKCPDIDIPFLPVKTDKLRFNTGIIEGNYDFKSIRFALTLGYEILECSNLLVYENTHTPFKEMIDKLYKLRKELKLRNDSSQLIPKIIMNSTYGKFGFNFTNKTNLIHEDNITNQNIDDVYITDIKDGKFIYAVKSNENSRIPSYVFPLYPIYVTANARITMYKHFQRVGFDKVFYSDTDCIFTTRTLQTSDELGEMKLEEQFEDLIIVKPKFYSGKTKDFDLIKIKGVNKAVKNYDDFKNLIKSKDFSVNMTMFRKLRSALKGRGHINEVYNMVKSIGLDDDKRLWDKPYFTLQPQESKPIKI